MKLSIITINYNNKIGFQTTLDSVLKQRFSNFEWIVIDGGSNDGSKELIQKSSSYISYCVSEPDKGIYNAMNKGVMASHGDYLMFLNSGDSLHDDTVLEQVVPLLLDKDIYVGRINSIGKTNDSEEEQADFSPEGILRKLTFTWIPHQASFFKRTFFEEYGLYREDKKIASDWWAYFSSIVLGKATIASIPILISDYDTKGISATQHSYAIQEQEFFLKEYPQINEYYKFYKDYYEMVHSMIDSRLGFLLFRIYFYFYRKFH